MLLRYSWQGPRIVAKSLANRAVELDPDQHESTLIFPPGSGSPYWRWKKLKNNNRKNARTLVICNLNFVKDFIVNFVQLHGFCVWLFQLQKTLHKLIFRKFLRLIRIRIEEKGSIRFRKKILRIHSPARQQSHLHHSQEVQYYSTYLTKLSYRKWKSNLSTYRWNLAAAIKAAKKKLSLLSLIKDDIWTILPSAYLEIYELLKIGKVILINQKKNFDFKFQIIISIYGMILRWKMFSLGL